MANKLSLANKYRPKTWEDLIEQDEIKVILENQIKTNNIKHVYLFTGSAGTGKTTSCRIIANKINEGKGIPIELDCASHNSVDDMRKIIDECKTRPLMGKYKIFILDEVHMLSVAAWNSMLKTLEEPPSYVIFLFATTDPQKIIGTIMSRVQRFNFSRITTKGIEGRLKYIIEKENEEHKLNNEELITYEESAIQYIARLAKGGMRDSITTLEKCLDYSKNLTLDVVHTVTSGGIDEDTLLKFMRLLLSNEAKESLLCFNDIYMSGIDISLFLRLYIEYIENCIKYIITQDENIVSLSELTINWLKENLNFVEDLKIQLLSTLNIRRDYSNEDLRVVLESWIIQSCN